MGHADDRNTRHILSFSTYVLKIKLINCKIKITEGFFVAIDIIIKHKTNINNSM